MELVKYCCDLPNENKIVVVYVLHMAIDDFICDIYTAYDIINMTISVQVVGCTWQTNRCISKAL